jgi:hypothetical protein
VLLPFHDLSDAQQQKQELDKGLSCQRYTVLPDKPSTQHFRINSTITTSVVCDYNVQIPIFEIYISFSLTVSTATLKSPKINTSLTK